MNYRVEGLYEGMKMIEIYFINLYNTIVATTTVGYVDKQESDSVVFKSLLMSIMFSGILVNGYMLTAIKSIFNDPQTAANIKTNQREDLEFWLFKKTRFGQNPHGIEPIIPRIDSFFRGYLHKNYESVINKWVMPTLKTKEKGECLDEITRYLIIKFSSFFKHFNSHT